MSYVHLKTVFDGNAVCNESDQSGIKNMYLFYVNVLNEYWISANVTIYLYFNVNMALLYSSCSCTLIIYRFLEKKLDRGKNSLECSIHTFSIHECWAWTIEFLAMAFPLILDPSGQGLTHALTDRLLRAVGFLHSRKVELHYLHAQSVRAKFPFLRWKTKK